VDKWSADPDMAQMLPQYFEVQGIPGFGAALAGDFLKEMGVQWLGKPDTWVRKIMAAAGWITDEQVTDFAVQRKFWEASEAVGASYPPIIIDKLMYLVGSGEFVMVAPEYKCSSRFQSFCSRLLAARHR
jgi:hypothetical protein